MSRVDGRPGGRLGRSRLVYSSDDNDISSAAAGDINGDGRADLVIAYSSYLGENGVDLLFGTRAGTFARRRRSRSTGQPPVAVALVDLNGDRRLDLVSANSEDESNRLSAGTVSVFLGRRGGFRHRRDYRIGGGADGLAVRDLNGDGRPDVAVSRGGAGPFVSVLLNRGGGTLGPNRDYRGAGGFADAVAAGDLNGDGRKDLVTVNGIRGLSILLNRGKGAFGPRLVIARREHAYSVVVGDVNGGGRLDILAQTVSRHVPLLVLLNTG